MRGYCQQYLVFSTKGSGHEKIERAAFREERMNTYLELLELSALFPAPCPLLFHALDGDETHILILWSNTDDRLHRRKGRIGGQRPMPVAEPDRTKGTLSECLDGSKGSYRGCMGKGSGALDYGQTRESIFLRSISLRRSLHTLAITLHVWRRFYT